MDNKIYFVNQAGYDLFLEELDNLKSSLNRNGKEKSESFASAIGDGWHDNFDFEEAARNEKKILKQIADRKKILGNLVIIKEEEKNQNIVGIDDLLSVKLEYDDNSIENCVFKLVGTFYSNNNTDDYQEITLNSPIGKAIYHKKIPSITDYVVNDKMIKVFIESKINK